MLIVKYPRQDICRHFRKGGRILRNYIYIYSSGLSAHSIEPMAPFFDDGATQDLSEVVGDEGGGGISAGGETNARSGGGLEGKQASDEAESAPLLSKLLSLFLTKD